MYLPSKTNPSLNRYYDVSLKASKLKKHVCFRATPPFPSWFPHKTYLILNIRAVFWKCRYWLASRAFTLDSLALLWISGRPVAKCDPLLSGDPTWTHKSPVGRPSFPPERYTFLHLVHSFNIYLICNIIHYNKKYKECKFFQQKTLQNVLMTTKPYF